MSHEVEPLLRAAGANVVISELEVALAMIDRLLHRFGASADQLERTRARVREDLTTTAPSSATERGHRR